MNEITSLTKQETKVLVALCSGSLYKEIAYDYKISINTVKKHLKNIYRKLSVGKRTQAIEKFIQFTSQQDGQLYNSTGQQNQLEIKQGVSLDEQRARAVTYTV
jgi:DNA-binding CsgD family transcriptional regulator